MHFCFPYFFERFLFVYVCVVWKCFKMSTYEQDGPEALRIAATIPYYPFHGSI